MYIPISVQNILGLKLLWRLSAILEEDKAGNIRSFTGDFRLVKCKCHSGIVLENGKV